MSDEALVNELAVRVASLSPYATHDEIRRTAERVAATGAYEMLPGGKLRPNLANPVCCAAASRINRQLAEQIANEAFPGRDPRAIASQLEAQGIDTRTLDYHQPPRDPNQPMTDAEIAEALGL